MSAETQGNGGWNQERINLLKNTVCPKGISNDEFALFLEQCKRSGLDPLLKEAFCVARRQNIGDRDRPNWVTKHEFQPSEAGMLARAERFPDYEGIQAAEVYGKDPISIDYGSGLVEHKVNPAQRSGGLVGAWARVQRRGKLAVVVWVDLGAVEQKTPLWTKMPATMVRKCARVAALRTAYPEAFGGLYVREEMPAEEFDDAPVSAAPVGQTRPVLERTALPAKSASTEASEVMAGMLKRAEPEAVPVTAPREVAQTQAATAPAASATPPAVGTVTFGPYKGKAASELSDEELSETIDLGNEKLMEQPKARWANAMRACMDDLEAEVGRRIDAAKAAQTPATRQPGED